MTVADVEGDISLDVARRFLLGRQGLWPGRRHAGKQGVLDAVHMLESVQIDPLTVIARSHDLELWNRVDGYQPSHLDELLYQDRKLFDYGGVLKIYPMSELPYWRLHMQRRRLDERYVTFVAANPDLLASVRAEIEQRGPLGNRDFAGSQRVNSYRSRKDTGLALYYLWITGELMTHSRRGFERLHDLRERVAPAQFAGEAGERESEHFFARKALRSVVLGTLRAWANSWSYQMHRKLDRVAIGDQMAALVAANEAVAVRVEGQKDLYYLPAGALPELEALQAGQVPSGWQASGSTTSQVVRFLSPLDGVLERTRLQKLFDFEYIWEVYKPAEKRRWGYYTVPILYGDRLVGRIDPKLERASATLAINGFWLEDDATASDPDFAAALGLGLSRFAQFHDARQVDLAGIAPAKLRKHLQAQIRRNSQ